MSDSTSKRLDSIDILRALGILIMVMGHVGFGGKFDRYIHTFHMPVFFLISGYLYIPKKGKSLLSIISKRAKRLMIPYVVYALINYVFWILLVKEASDSFYEQLIRLVTYNTEKLPICGALWFLTALFFAEVFYLIFDRIFAKPLCRTISVLIIAVTVSFVQNSTTVRLPLTIDIAVVCVGFYELGRVYKDSKFRIEEKLKKSWMYIVIGGVLAAINLVLAFVNDYVNIKSGWYGIVPLFWINAVIGSFAFYLFAIWGERVTKEKNLFRRFLVVIGRCSMVFLGLNQLFIMVFSMLYGRLGLNINMYISGVVIFVVTVAALYAISILLKILNRKKLNLLFGL